MMDDLVALAGLALPKDERPWGWFLTLAEHQVEPICAVKVLVVLPGQSLSLQFHKDRSERWTPLGAGLWATIGNRTGEMTPGLTYEVGQGVVHRLENRGDHPVRLVEVMFGRYAEDDIVRLDDRYGRG